MDPRVILTTFSTLFLAEMGDKTQLAVIMLVASTKQPWSVLLGAVAALALVTAIGVAGGQVLTRFVPPGLLHKAASIAFIAIGAVMLVKGPD